MRILLILLMLSNSVFAQDVVYLPKNTPAPYSGYIFSIPKEREVRLRMEELKYCDKSKELLNKLNTDYESKSDILLGRIEAKDKQIENLSEQLSKSDSIFSKVGFFILGAVVTGGIAYGVSRTLK